MKLPAMLFGVGRYTVTVQLPEAAGLYGAATSPIAASKWVGWNRAPDRHRRRGGAVAEIRTSYRRIWKPRCTANRRSANSTSLLLPRNGTPAAEERRRDSARRTSVPPDINTLLAEAVAA